MERNHSITLANGTVIGNLGLNGSNYISDTEVNPAIFSKKNCSPIVFNDGATNEEHPHMELVHILKNEDEWWIALRDIPAPEIAEQKLRADVDYIAMMTDVDL